MLFRRTSQLFMVKKLTQMYSLRFLLTVVCGCLIVLFGTWFFLMTHQVFSANFADEVMRPILGNTATIYVESVFFAAQDDINQIRFHFVKPSANVFSDAQKVAGKVVSQPTFSLTPISINHSAFVNEGVWVPIKTDGKTILMAQTFLQPDPTRSYAIAALVKLNMQALSIDAVAGTWEPGEATHPGPGKVPDDVQKSNILVAAFNGGFQKKDGEYGMIVGNTTYLPLQKNLATLFMYTDKKPQIVNFAGGTLASDVTSVRQNGPMLIQDGKIVANSVAWNMQTWGLTTTNSMYTWRSGLGVTKDGNLVYAVGPSLVPNTLAKALQLAGAVNAMQLDINPVWVRFALYNSIGSGQYTSQMLLKDMTNGGIAYLTGYEKDFFYVYEKQTVTPTPTITQPLTIFTNSQNTPTSFVQ